MGPSQWNSSLSIGIDYSAYGTGVNEYKARLLIPKTRGEGTGMRVSFHIVT